MLIPRKTGAVRRGRSHDADRTSRRHHAIDSMDTPAATRARGHPAPPAPTPGARPPQSPCAAGWRPNPHKSRHRGGLPERGIRCVETVSRRDSETRKQAVRAALDEGAPKAEEEDGSGRGGDGKPENEAPEQQAEHRIPSWRWQFYEESAAPSAIPPPFPSAGTTGSSWRSRFRWLCSCSTRLSEPPGATGAIPATRAST